jgi:hypothetical protein
MKRSPKLSWRALRDRINADDRTYYANIVREYPWPVSAILASSPASKPSIDAAARLSRRCESVAFDWLLEDIGWQPAPAFYKEFLSMYGAGDFGSVTVLSPDPESGFPIWETTLRLENRECNFMGVVELDSDYYGFLIKHGVCSNDIRRVDHELDYDILYTDYPDLYDFLAKAGLGIWDESEASEQEDDSESEGRVGD